LEAARRREIGVVLVWRLDRWGRSVTGLLATLQELEHLGVGFVSLTEALDLTTPAGRAMAGLLAVFAEFEREILQERVRAGLARRGRTARDWAGPLPPDSTPSKCGNCIGPGSANPKSLAACQSAVPRCAGF
jgi:DNA invertase Pin-like site-specific DNA recombinase